MANIQNVRIGVCSISFNGVDLGHTLGGVSLNYEPSHTDLKVDQYGDTPVDKALTGENLQVVARLAEVTLANLKKAIPAGELETGANGSKLEIGANAGKLMSTEAYQLVLHPIKNGASDYSEDVTIYKAVAVEALNLDYSYDNQRVVEVTFQALIDEAKSVGSRLGHIGVPSIS